MKISDAEIRKIAAWWSRFGHPIRPGLEEIEIFRSQISERKNLCAMILGATPEYVNLLLQEKAKTIVIVDYYGPNVKAMETLGGRDWSSVEVVHSDWMTENARMKGKFDVVFGDNSFIFTRYPEDWKRLFRTLFKYLKPGGRIIARCLFQPDVPFDYHRYVNELMDNILQTGMENLSDKEESALRDQITAIRPGTLLGAVDSASTVSGAKRNELIQSARDILAEKFQNTPLWDIIEDILYLESGKRGEFIVASVPPLEEVKKLLTGAGFIGIFDIPSGNRPFKGAFRILVAEKPVSS